MKPVKRRSSFLRSSKLSKTLLVILGIITGAHVVDVSVDKDFRSGLTSALVDALTVSSK